MLHAGVQHGRLARKRFRARLHPVRGEHRAERLAERGGARAAKVGGPRHRPRAAAKLEREHELAHRLRRR
jgi:hypothetical protein